MVRWIYRFQIKPGRWIFIQAPDEKEFGKNLNSTLKKLCAFPSYYYHLNAGGHVAALKSHVADEFFCSLDIENFFGSINKTRVTRTLKEFLGYPKARAIAERCVVKIYEDGVPRFRLPFGYVQSPYLASICLYKSKLGKLLDKLSSSVEVNISVYMDDIVISSNNEASLAAIMKEIRVTAERSNFFVNNQKSQGPSKRIVVFNVELSKGNLDITAERMREFSELYNSGGSIFQKEGILNYIISVNPGQASQI